MSREMAALKSSNKRDKDSNETNAEGVDDDSNTSLAFDKLPNEMLQKIFEQLINSKLVNNQSYLNYRLVNSRWKSVMERELEKDALSIWKTKSVPISLTDTEAEPPALGCIFVLKPEDRGTPSEWAYLPPPLESIEEKVNPFPSRSLKITSDLGDSTQLPGSRKPRRGTQLIWLISFFSKFGDLLTSLILTSVTLTPDTFNGILGNTPNLKALNLMRVLFRGDLANCAQLPALQKLQHVRVFKVMIIKKKEDAEWIDRFNDGSHGQNELYDWILSPYKEQLVTLDIFGNVGIRCATNFANLERLFVYHVKFVCFLEPNMFQYPRLKSLFLMNAEIKTEDIMKWFQRYIEPLAKTLSELHLDLPQQRELNGRLFQLSPKLTHSQNKTDKVVFPEMKTFAITVPQFPEEEEVIKTLIEGFPNLEKLMFLNRYCLKFHVAVGDTQSVLSSKEFIKVCPKLKKVKIQP
ncbi:unnamed protein product [Orchesella dallaii]|uniref:F-box domain-containing protein n=1 Tax=Orchesella dallaii TaxID=48710 RepID=A0ABP1RK34_9HEXA